MTTHFRTLLLLGFTALAASLSGCIVETTSGGPNSSCAYNRYIQVYWAINNGGTTPNLTCPQAPAAHVELETNDGIYPVGRQCQYLVYDQSLTTDFAGSTDDGVPAGTYVISARLVADGSNAVLATAGGSGPGYAVPSCERLEVGYLFQLF